MTVEGEKSVNAVAEIQEFLAEWEMPLTTQVDVPLATGYAYPAMRLLGIRGEIIKALAESDFTREDLIDFIADRSIDLVEEGMSMRDFENQAAGLPDSE